MVDPVWKDYVEGEEGSVEDEAQSHASSHVEGEEKPGFKGEKV